MDERYTPSVAAPPSALVVRHHFSMIWIIPILAAIIAGWLGWRSYLERGPVITITFETAEGLEAGRTKIKHKNTDLGQVESVEPSSDLTHVVVKARMNSMAEAHLTSGTRFWVVRPRLSAEGVSGLNTIISGAYIELDPGQGKPQSHYTGIEEPPVISADEPGETFTLHAAQLGSIGQGTAVYFRGIQVGQVLGYDLSDADGSATVHVFVRAPHNKLVHKATRFWNASGITAIAGSDGMKIQMESLQSLLTGGVAFDVPPKTDPGEMAGHDTEFNLYGNISEAYDAVYTRKIPFMLYFTGPVPGLVVGSQVRMQGLQVGYVSDVHIEYDDAAGRVLVPITIEVEPDRITMLHKQNDAPSGEPGTDDYALFRKFVSLGLRARLGSGNLLTGQKVINLDFTPDADHAALIEGGKYPQIPTLAPDDLDSVIHSAQGVLSSLQTTVSTLNKAITSPAMAQSMRSLNESLANLDRITHDASTRVGPLLDSLKSVADSADDTIKHAGTAIASGDGGGDLAGTLRELKNAARSIRVLAEYLETHPEALVRGKAGSAAQ